jgi:hypothetical protein
MQPRERELMLCRVAAFLLSVAACDIARSEEPSLLPEFRRTSEFAEQERWQRLESGVRMYFNAPLELKRPNRVLVVFATPNGNTIEQTLGCSMAQGRDWHFDIQHVAAQIRRLREISSEEDIVLAVVQAPKLSWPAFRQADSNSSGAIKAIVELAAAIVGAKRFVLVGHSGGGSFVFGFINAQDAIPASVERMVFLDANYAYSDDEKHGDKLLAWLRGDVKRRLVTVAYDDREITLNGKRVVSPTGGAFRASQRMVDRFCKDVSLSDEMSGPFIHRRGLSGQIEFFIHPNPDNKILHTALVGEMNGLLHGLTLGTPRETKWGTFGGPRAYTKWIQTEPTRESEAPTEFAPLNLPPRPAGALSGSAFLKRIEPLSREDREAAVRAQIMQGNVPDFLRRLVPVPLQADDHARNEHLGTCFVTPDYLAIGNDSDFFRMPMTPQTAQAIAAAANASLITKKLSDDLFKAAKIKLDPKPLTTDRESAATFYQHHQVIEEQRRGQPLGRLIAGIKKDVVLTNRLKEKPNRVAIYGWHYADAKPIQPLYVGHVDWYVDYSHGVRLVHREMKVDRRTMKFRDVLRDKELSCLISDEGPIEFEYE